MSGAAFAAVDLGASSGRVMVGRVDRAGIDLSEVHRFANRPVTTNGSLHWDVLALFAGVLDGLRSATRAGAELASVGIDSWAVDYGLLDADGELLGNPYHYRDRRTDGVMDRVLAKIPAAEIYATTGIQFLPFNTIYQLVAGRDDPSFGAARHAVLIPDLFGFWLTGQLGTEVTNASTTQLFDATTHEFALPLLGQLGIPADLFPSLISPGDVLGPVHPTVVAATGIVADTPVLAVGSHDTASAVAGVPAVSESFAYVSCGTWSLVGLELDRPVLTEASREANFTNELGVDATVRYLRNVMGLWLLQECQREWARAGLPADLETLLFDARRIAAFSQVVDVDDPRFLPPGDMPARIAAVCRESGQTPPQSQAETVRCIVDSLALAYRRAVREAQELSGREVDVVHLVGGGARNQLLCQLTADACGLPVVAGPVEAAALGNVVVQARAAGVVGGGLPDLRRLIAASQPLRRFEPSDDPDRRWATAESRFPGH